MLAAVGYDARAQVLAVKFHSGAVYHYAGVTHRVYQGLKYAFAPGRYFDKVIRGQFPSRRMTGECDGCGRAHVWFGDPCPACGHLTPVQSCA